MNLLDGTTWDKKELLEKMNDDSFYYGYLSTAALSSSSLKLLLDSPKTYRNVTQYGNEESQALRDGWLFHTAILEPEVFESQVFVDVASKNTKAYKMAKEEHGKVFTMTEKNDAERLADAFLRNTKAVELIRGCDFEVPVIGEVMGFPFRGKADVLGKNQKIDLEILEDKLGINKIINFKVLRNVLGTDRIVDLKTTTDIKAFPYSAKKYSYDIQCYLYCELFNVSYNDFTFLVMDKKSVDIGVFHSSKEFYEAGRVKVEKALEIYDTYFLQATDLDQYYIEGIL
jgi:hypothetical protein